MRLNDCEYRWLSLPRVSKSNKRPDHVAELFVPNSKPILFVVESKERGNKLETGIGVRLKGYLHWLMDFSPGVSKSDGGKWQYTDERIDVENFEFIFAGAYINNSRHNNQLILQKSKCDLLFLFTPDEKNGFWKIEILANTESQEAEKIKRILLEQLVGENDGIFIDVDTSFDNPKGQG